MALHLISVNAAGIPTCKTSSDSSIDIGGIQSGQFGIKALPVARNAAGSNISARITAAAPYAIPISAATAVAFSGMTLGFTITAAAAGALTTPYDGLYRLGMGVGISADLPTSGYDENTTYSAEIRSNGTNIHLAQEVDMTGILPSLSGTGSTSAGAFRYEELYKILPAGTLLLGLVKVKTGGGGHYHAYSSITAEYLGPGVQNI